MKPDWDRLGMYFNHKSNAYIVLVDCTVKQSRGICEKQAVSQYPTIKYYGPDYPDGEDYDGLRGYTELKKFVKRESRPPCDVKSLEHCLTKEKAFLETVKDLSQSELLREGREMYAAIQNAEDEWKRSDDSLWEQENNASATEKRINKLQKQLAKTMRKESYKVRLLTSKLELLRPSRISAEL